MREQFISEAIKPMPGTFDTSRMAMGEPGLPQGFVWRGRTVTISSVVRSWHDTGKCTHGSPEMYVRKHWYEVETAADGVMKIYFDRQPRTGRRGARWWLFSVLAALALCCLPLASQADEFSRPRPVVILNYPGTAMEPFISKDGKYLFFNNSNSPGPYTDIYYALRVTDGVFALAGRVRGASAPAPSLDAVPSMDASGNFFFVSTRSYDSTLQSLYSGVFQNGSVSGPHIVQGDVARLQAGWLTMDAEISAGGQSLYFADAFFNGGSAPSLSDLVVANRASDGQFLRAPDSAAMFQNINTPDLEYAPSISADGLELFFTRLNISNLQVGIYRARRASAADPFGPPEKLTSITGFVEAPSLSSDGKTLYFHKKVGDKYVIFRTTR